MTGSFVIAEHYLNDEDSNEVKFSTELGYVRISFCGKLGMRIGFVGCLFVCFCGFGFFVPKAKGLRYQFRKS